MVKKDNTKKIAIEINIGGKFYYIEIAKLTNFLEENNIDIGD